MNAWSRSAEENSSSLLFSRVVLRSPKSSIVCLNFAPWPPKFAAVCSSRSVSAPLGVGAVRAQRDGQLVEAAVDLVELERDRGALGLEDRVVGEHVALLVGRRQLDVAVADDRRRDDDGLGVGGDLDLFVVGHDDLDLGAFRGDLVDLADRDAEHADVAALVDRHGAREVRRHGLGARCRVPKNQIAPRRRRAGRSRRAARPAAAGWRSSDTTSRTRDGRQVRDVGVPPGTVGEHVGEDRVERRHQLERPVKVVLVLVDTRARTPGGAAPA